MHGASIAALARSIKNGRTPVPKSEHPFPAFVLTVRGLWPEKTAAHLAAASGVSERCAKFWLSGDRAPSTAAFMAVFDIITGRNAPERSSNDDDQGRDAFTSLAT